VAEFMVAVAGVDALSAFSGGVAEFTHVAGVAAQHYVRVLQ
jgi:hypothetical protein